MPEYFAFHARIALTDGAVQVSKPSIGEGGTYGLRFAASVLDGDGVEVGVGSGVSVGVGVDAGSGVSVDVGAAVDVGVDVGVAADRC
jgi:hypothetical protein